MLREIDPNFLHDGHGERVEFARVRARTLDVMIVTEEFPGQPLGHLASGRIGYAEKQDIHG